MQEKEAGSEPREDISLGAVLTSEGFDDQDRADTEAAEGALLNRPSFSIRARVILAFAIFFLLPLTITIWTMNVFDQLQSKILFLEVADDYKMEIQQARRFEKNFLLYGTNLEDAREHAQAAQALCRRHRDRLRPVVGDAALDTMKSQLVAYLELLDILEAGGRPRAEEELRDHGAQLVALAQDFVEKERGEVHSLLSQFRRMPFVFLGSLFVVMAVSIAFLARHILGTLNRFIGYTERIASGDLTPVSPARRFRDEFSTLAVHINRMVRALDHQHRILVESHKLRAMGNLVAGVAHELNNPMNNILLTASVLEEDYETLEPEERMEMLQDLVGEAERTRKIVANLLDFARQSETKVEPLDIVKTLEECAQLVGNQLRLKKVKLKLEVPAELPVVHGDRQLLSQVFANLIMNALDVIEEGGEIRIGFSTKRREGFVAVDVSDSGPGMPEDVLEKVFDPFFTTKPKGRGTGLGLSVSQGIVRKLGGHLLVKSEVGVGSTFTVLLPVTTIPSDIASRPGSPEQGGEDAGPRP